MKTEGLKQALDAHGFDVAFGGARRDEERVEPKSAFSLSETSRTAGTLKISDQSFGISITVERIGESIRVFRFELDGAGHLAIHLPRHIPIVPLYFAAERPVIERNGMLIMVDDDRKFCLASELSPEPSISNPWVLSIDWAIDSKATDVADIVLELLQSTSSERQGRAIDTDSSGSMEKKKQEGYLMQRRRASSKENGQTLLTAASNTDLSKANVTQYLEGQSELDLLRFVLAAQLTMARAHSSAACSMKPNSFLMTRSGHT